MFLLGVCKKLEINTEEAGNLVGICGRSYRDWIRGKLLPRKDAIEKFSEISGIPIPKILEEREEWWSGRVNGKIGGAKRLKLYGVTFTQDDRIKGGHISQVRRETNPDYYRQLGCNVPTLFKVPRKSAQLAEFLGIVLGDGGLTDGQCEISLHITDDAEYAQYVKTLADTLFRSHASICPYPKHTVIKIVISGVKFTEILESFGLRRGHKIRHQVDIPNWIKNNPKYLKACMRGLFDTDGGTFTHRHVVNSHKYRHFGLVFASASKPLLASYITGLRMVGLVPHSNGVDVFSYGEKVTQEFFDIFKPSNPKFERRFRKYLASGGSRLGKVK